MLFEDLENKKLTKVNILNNVSEYDIYNYFLGEVPLNTVINSPFRKDNNPSFGLFISKNNELIYNDFKLGAGNCIMFVQKLHNITYFEALSLINQVFKINLYDTVKYNNKYKKKANITNYIPDKKDSSIIRIKLKDWTNKDIDYFHPLDITKIYGIYPISNFWINQYSFKASELAYAWRYGTNIYKIYQPLTPDSKWWTNISNNVVWYGDSLLPEKGDLLFVTSSNKDAAVLHQIGFNAIAPHTESQKFSQEQFDNYNKRFDKIIIFYDNDETGILKAKSFCDTYNLTYLALEEESTKDPFEFIKQYDLTILKEWIEQWIK